MSTIPVQSPTEKPPDPSTVGLFFAGGIAGLILAAIGIVGGGGILCNPSVYDNRGDLTEGICLFVVGVPLLVFAIWSGRTGVRRLAILPIAGVEQVTGELPHDAEPAPTATVIAALEALNSRGLPYCLEFSTNRWGRPVITVRWRIEDDQWKTILGTGEVKRTWVMRVTLRHGGHYTFHETSALVAWDASLAQMSVTAQRSWFVGKSFGAMGLTKVWTPGHRQSFAMVRPSDAKIPVFAILRAYGWRPRHDWWGNRMWEY